MELPETLKLVIFDFDGTLHDMTVDWPTARRKLKVEAGESLGAAVERHKQTGHEDLIDELTILEAEALAHEQLDQKVQAVLVDIGKRFKTAVFSRNSSKVIKHFLENSGIKPDMIIGREEVK